MKALKNRVLKEVKRVKASMDKNLVRIERHYKAMQNHKTGADWDKEWKSVMMLTSLNENLRKRLQVAMAELHVEDSITNLKFVSTKDSFLKMVVKSQEAKLENRNRRLLSKTASKKEESKVLLIEGEVIHD